MNTLRTSILARRRLALLLVAIVLFAKVFVPTGYMFTPTVNGFIVQMCSGQGSMPVMVDMGHSSPVEDHSGSGKVDAPCAFSDIAMAATAGVDAVLLVAAIAFIVALGVLPRIATPRRPAARLRPPLRGPPAFS